MKNISVNYLEFRPVVQGRCCFTDIPIFSSGDHFVWQSGTLRERSGSVVECLARDRRAAGSSLTGVTALCP